MVDKENVYIFPNVAALSGGGEYCSVSAALCRGQGRVWGVESTQLSPAPVVAPCPLTRRHAAAVATCRAEQWLQCGDVDQSAPFHPPHHSRVIFCVSTEDFCDKIWPVPVITVDTWETETGGDTELWLMRNTIQRIWDKMLGSCPGEQHRWYYLHIYIMRILSFLVSAASFSAGLANTPPNHPDPTSNILAIIIYHPPYQ